MGHYFINNPLIIENSSGEPWLFLSYGFKSKLDTNIGPVDWFKSTPESDFNDKCILR